jgi:tRNA dimethylallyltransferase
MLPEPLPPPDRPVLLSGPTAGGKSALALALARAQGREVVNADALQVHAAWRVLTARPDPADEALVPHRLYGHVAPGEPYSVGHWLRELAPLLARRPAPVIVGGTGLFFSALTEGLAPIPEVPAEIRAEAEALRARAGLAALVAGLDTATAARIDLNNPARVQRAWEVRAATGRGLAEWQARTGPPLLPVEAAECWLLDPGAALADRIAARFDAMLAGGALAEVAAALPLWPDRGPLPPWARAIGAAELAAYLRGQMSWTAAREAAILATRRYAKRQRTWFRNRFRSWRRLPAP